MGPGEFRAGYVHHRGPAGAEAASALGGWCLQGRRHLTWIDGAAGAAGAAECAAIGPPTSASVEAETESEAAETEAQTGTGTEAAEAVTEAQTGAGTEAAEAVAEVKERKRWRRRRR